jgi:hypothetical protein
MSTSSYGEISLRDYARLTAPRRRWLLTLGKFAGALIACASLMAAGDFIGPWTGKHSRDLSLHEALALIEEASAEQWSTEIGLGVAHLHVEKAIDQIHKVAKRDDKPGEYASLYLRNVGRRCVAHLRELADLGIRPDAHEGHLQIIVAEAKK